jgi:hypothetical protein
VKQTWPYLPPEAPPELAPVPFQDRTLDLVLGAATANRLAGHGFVLVKDLAAFRGDLTQFKGIGPGTAQTCRDALAAEANMAFDPLALLTGRHEVLKARLARAAQLVTLLSDESGDLEHHTLATLDDLMVCLTENT